MQHYVFALHAFVNSIQKRGSDSFSYLIKETRTDEVLFREYDLEFHPLMVCDTYAYLSKSHPLADREELSLEELRDYLCVSFDQTNETEFYLSEEALSGYDFNKLIRSNDRATSCEILTMLNGFAIGTGIMVDSNALKDTFVSVKLKEEDPLTIGYIMKKNHVLSDFGKLYIIMHSDPDSVRSAWRHRRISYSAGRDCFRHCS